MDNSNANLKKEIVKILNLAPHNEEFVVNEIIHSYEGNVENSVICEFLKLLTHLDLSEEESKKFWFEIIKHKKLVAEKLGRDVGLRVSILDYFVNINKMIDNPTFVEIHIYEFLTKLTLIDELTFIYNRRFFDNAIEKEYYRSKRYGTSLSLLFFDLDNFKEINDNYGHKAGDILLQEIGHTLNDTIRKEDMPCRYGGEEFVVILPNTDKTGAVSFSDRINTAINKIKLPEIENRDVTISAGIATYPDDTDDYKELIILADKAMYKAKFSGKNQILHIQDIKKGD